jgi:signal transduction histidine kinase
MQSSRLRLVVSLAVIVISTLVFLGTGIYVARRLENLLDARLGDALLSLAKTVASEMIVPSQDDPVALELTIVTLARARRESGAEMIVLLDRTGRIIAADPPALGRESYLTLDNDALASAMTGMAAYGERYRVDDVDLKSAFAPVKDPFGQVMGVVGIEAPADFFGALRDVRLMQGLSMVIGLLIVFGLTAVMWRFWSRSEISDKALLRTQHLATIGQMTATMAHEIRNPLSIIRSTADLIRRRHGDGSEIFDFIPEEVDRLDRLTKWYLDFARPTEARFEAISLVTVVNESISRLRKEAEVAGVTMEPPADGTDGTCQVDHDRVLQAVINVLMNAVNATPRGGEIHARVIDEGSEMRIEIEDTGHGIPEDRLAHVFEPFHTSRAAGSGLGLAVVSQVLEAHGGTVGIESTPGEGTTVHMTFPKVQTR